MVKQLVRTGGVVRTIDELKSLIDGWCGPYGPMDNDELVSFCEHSIQLHEAVEEARELIRYASEDSYCIEAQEAYSAWLDKWGKG